jgi:hypothetical protein
MALPVYQRRGIMYADLPRVETANLQESARSFETINRRLDQLQSFIKKEGTEYAQEQAMQYAAQNPVTEAQIAEAVASKGEQKSWLSALTGGNVYDETLQAAQGSMLANQLSIEAQKKFRELQVLAENNQIGFDEAQVEIQDVIDGYAATISAFSPEASIKARASMATAGNGVLKSVAEKQSKIFAANQAAKLDEDIFSVRRFAEDEFYRGDSWNPTTQSLIRAEDRIGAIFNPIEEQAVAMGQQGRLPKLLEAKREARINGVTRGLLDEKFAASPTKAYQRIINNDLGEYESSWAVMSDDERDKVKSKFIKEIADRKKFSDQAEKEQKESYKQISIDLMREAETADPTRQKEIANELWQNNSDAGEMVTPRTYLEKLAEGKIGEELDNAELIFELETAVDDGMMNDEAIKYLAQNNQINWTQARKLQDRIVKTENREIRAANRRIVAEIDKLPLKPQQKTQMKAELKSEVLKAPPDVNLQELIDVAVQRKVNSIEAQRATSVQMRIAAALRKVSAFSDLEDTELESKAAELMQNPTLIKNIKMDDSVRRAINNAIKSLER